jgi:hypothetical protein
MGVSNRSRERQHVARAQRFATMLACRYRETGTSVWHEGRTSNISLSGVLFEAAKVLRPRTTIELAVVLPVVPRDAAFVEIRGRGSIVRNAGAKAKGGWPVLAASMTGYQVVRGRLRQARVSPHPAG